jgi:hypothetical protein
VETPGGNIEYDIRDIGFELLGSNRSGVFDDSITCPDDSRPAELERT